MPTPLLQTISHVRLPWREGLWQITLEQGIIRRQAPQNHGQRDGEGVLNAEGGLAIPPFVEPHIHLDTTQTAGDPRSGMSPARYLRVLPVGRSTNPF